MRKNEKGSYDLLLQKRSENKDAFPGCYDISSAGHLPAGQDYLSSALRELEEELGIKAKPEQLHFMGLHEGCCEETFYGKPFKNHEISHVYLYQEPVNIEDLTLQKEEVQEVCWLDFKECCKKVKDGIKCCAGNADQSGISVGEKGSPDAKPYLNNCKQNNQNGGCDIREAQMGNIATGQISHENIKDYKVIKSGSKAGKKFFST